MTVSAAAFDNWFDPDTDPDLRHFDHESGSRDESTMRVASSAPVWLVHSSELFHSMDPADVGTLAIAQSEQAVVPSRVRGQLLFSFRRWVAVAAFVLGALFLFLPNEAEAEGPPPTTVTYVVQPGDTLWELASAVTAEGGSVGAMIETIKISNGLTSSMLMVGDEIQLPSSR